MAFAQFQKSEVKFTNQMPKEYESSTNVVRTFCEECGSPIEWRDAKRPDKTCISLGLFEDPNQFDVEKDVWIEQKVSWE